MNDAWGIFGAVALAHALGVASPGPDFAIVIRQTLAHGRRIGLATALGIGSGIVFHVGLGMFGLQWLVDRFPDLLQALRFGGAAFLLWMGAQALRAQPSAPPHDPLVSASADGASARAHAAYGIGLATNLLNPKAALFFVALCSSVVTAGASIALRLALGLWLALATAAWFSFVAYTVGHVSVRRRLAAIAPRIDQAMGLILIALAVVVAFGDLLASR